MAKDIFLAGATGAIGRQLTRLLTLRGHRVFGMTRRTDRAEALKAAGAVPVVADAFDAAALMHTLQAIRPHAVLHQLTDLPSNFHPELLTDALRRNARLRQEGTRNLVAASLGAGTPRLIAQSIAWAYRPGTEPHTETAALDTTAQGQRAISVAGIVALEGMVLATPGIEGCVLRYGHLYGPGTASDESTTQPMPLHVVAAAWAAVLALETGAIGAFNIAEPNDQVSTRNAKIELGWRHTMRIDLRPYTAQ